VRVSPDELSFIDAHAWRDIYGHGPKEGKGSAPPKNWSRYGKSLNGSPSIIIIQDPVEHARARKIFTPAFSDRALTQQAPLFIKYADQLVRSLKDGGKDNGKFDMVRMYNFATFDVMGDLTFGEPLHMLDNAEYDPWVRAIFANIKRGVQLGLIYNYYPLVASTFRALFHRTVAKTQYTHMNFSATRVTKRLEKGRESAGVDLWDLVLAQEDKGKAGLTRGEMDTNSGLFMVAGTETTATLLSGLTYLLLSTSNGEYMIKLVDEIRGAFTSSDDISMEATQALPYLNACIKEALRMYPPVPIGLPHLTPKEGSTICGVFVPSGVRPRRLFIITPANVNRQVTVAAPHYAMYTSPTNFTTPRVFLPERWLGDERFATDNRSALQPFSVGSRDCLGKK
jgi:cytochrome P450